MYSNSLLNLAEKNQKNHKIFSAVENELESVVFDYLSRVQQVHEKLSFSADVISAISQILKAHLEWNDLRNDLLLLKKKREILANLLLGIHENVEHLGALLDEIDDKVVIPEPETISYTSIETVKTADGTRKKRILTNLIANSPILEAEQLAKSGVKVLLIEAKQNYDEDYAILQERYSTLQKWKIGLLRLSPLPLSHPRYSR